MQSSDFEKLVEAYLLYDRSTLVAPQFLIRVAGKDRFIDTLAVQLRERVFFLVEVTENRRPAKLARKVKDIHSNSSWLADRLKLDFGLDGAWKVMPWLFIRKDADEAFKKALSGIIYKRTFIEDLVLSRVNPSLTLNSEIWGALVEPSTED